MTIESAEHSLLSAMGEDESDRDKLPVARVVHRQLPQVVAASQVTRASSDRSLQLQLDAARIRDARRYCSAGNWIYVLIIGGASIVAACWSVTFESITVSILATIGYFAVGPLTLIAIVLHVIGMSKGAIAAGIWGVVVGLVGLPALYTLLFFALYATGS